MRRIEEALSDKSKYCYDNGVLFNKLNITDQKEFDKVEASLTYLRINMLSQKDYKFSFDVNYYLSIHKYIFQDLYEFAGEIRSENITKGNTPFCRPEFVFNYLKYTLEELKKDIRKIDSFDKYVCFLSKYYGEINMIHPFREGNGRVLRTYFLLLVNEINNYISFGKYEIDYSLWNDEDRDNLLKYVIIDSNTVDVEKVGINGIAMCFDKVLISILSPLVLLNLLHELL